MNLPDKNLAIFRKAKWKSGPGWLDSSHSNLACLVIYLTVTFFFFSEERFPDSTRRGDAEAGDNNQVQVALVFIPFS